MNLIETKEWITCAKDPVYFLSKYGSAFDIRTRQVTTGLTLFEYQEETLRDYVKHKNNIILKSRQTGLSVITAGYVAWKLIFGIDERILIVANDGAAAIRFLKAVKQFLDLVPKYLLPESRIKDNEKFIEFSNGCFAKAVASSEQAGRGESLTLLILDEAAFIDNAESIWMGAGLALAATKGSCIMISTPYGTGGLYHSTWIGSKKGENEFNPITIHWTQHPIFNVGMHKKINELGKEVYTSPWYERECERMNGDKVKIAQELDLSFEGSRAVVIPSEVIDAYEKSIIDIKPACYIDYKIPTGFCDYKTPFHVWEKPQADKNYIIGCLPPGEKVLTNEGIKNIEEVTLGHLLIDENGNYTKIKNIQITENGIYDNFTIKLSNVYRTTTFTENHPILASVDTKIKRNYKKNHANYEFNERYWDFDFKFHNASNLKKGDWVKYPNIYKNSILTEAQIIELWKPYKNANRTDFTIKNPLLDSEFWWFVGMWLAEGWTYKRKYANSILTAHNIKEEKIINRIKNLMIKYNRVVTVTEKTKINSAICQFTSTQISAFFDDNFGKYAKNKYIPEWVKHLPENFKLQLIKGYLDGDGCTTISKRRKNPELKTSFVSVSLELLEGVQDILFSCGIISCLKKLRSAQKHKIRNRIINSSITYELNLGNYDSIKLLNKFNIKNEFKTVNKRIINNCFFDKNEEFIYFKIKNITSEKYIGNVYNFETEQHTFLCKNITTHNCDVARGDNADYSTIQILDADDCRQVAELQIKVMPDVFAEIIYFAANLYNKAYVVVECNSFGLATALHLRNYLKYDSRRMCHVKSQVKLFNRTSGYVANNDELIPGFQTTTKTRPLVITSLSRYMSDGSVKLNSSRVLDELKTFIYNKDKPEHAPGFNDDLVFALALALYIRDTEFEKITYNTESAKALLGAFSRVTVKTKDIQISGNHMNARPQQNLTRNSPQGPQPIDDGLWLL